MEAAAVLGSPALSNSSWRHRGREGHDFLQPVPSWIPRQRRTNQLPKCLRFCGLSTQRPVKQDTVCSSYVPGLRRASGSYRIPRKNASFVFSQCEWLLARGPQGPCDPHTRSPLAAPAACRSPPALLHTPPSAPAPSLCSPVLSRAWDTLPVSVPGASPGACGSLFTPHQRVSPRPSPELASRLPRVPPSDKLGMVPVPPVLHCPLPIRGRSFQCSFSVERSLA